MAGDPNWGSVPLLMHMTGVNGSATLADSSGFARTMTANAAAQLSTAQSKFGGSSLYLDGNGSYVSCAFVPELQLHTGDYTVEMNVYFLAAPVGSAIYSVGYNNSHIPLAIFFSTAVGTDTAGSNLNVGYYVNGTGWFGISTGWAPALNTWYHIAVTRAGNTLYAFVDGAPKGTFNIVTQPASSTAVTYVGRRWDTTVASYAINGYIDEVRVTKGVARYTAAFTPPSVAFPDGMGQVLGTVKDAASVAAPRIVRAYRRDTGALVKEAYTCAPDPSINSVGLLLHGIGPNGAAIVDSALNPKVVTVNGGAAITTAQHVYGKSSIGFNGTSSYLSVPDSNDWDFPGDFTIELSARFNTHAAIMCLVDNYNTTSGWFFQRRNDTNVLAFGWGNTPLIQPSWTPVDGTWYHLAVCRAAGTLRIFVNGAPLASVADATNLSGSPAALLVGGLFDGSVVRQFFDGQIQDLRITKGVARYTAAFTPPTDRLPDASAGPALGSFGFYTPTLDEIHVLCLDDDAGTVETDKVLRVVPA